MIRRLSLFKRAAAPLPAESEEDTSSSRPPDSADPRYELVLNQVLRALTQQQSVLDNLRARAGTLVATASLVSSFFGATALADRANPPGTAWVILAFAFLFVVVIAAIIVAWPYQWHWGISGHQLLTDYVEACSPATLDEMRRSLAYYIQEDITANEKNLRRLWWALRAAILAVAAEVTCWVLALATR